MSSQSCRLLQCSGACALCCQDCNLKHVHQKHCHTDRVNVKLRAALGRQGGSGSQPALLPSDAPNFGRLLSPEFMQSTACAR